jgi:hypothetical protein
MLDPDAEFYFIWHPTSVEEGWRPYSNGRWVWTTDGWMWASNHTWGWAVFHYGRWWNSPRYGWVWMPGYVWAPAWVQWRISENHIGWCPLTPDARWNSEFGISSGNYSYRNRNADWVFIEKNKFADDIGSSNIITSSENKGLVERSNSILDLRSENDRIFNNGPDVKDVESRTGKMMKQKMIKYTNSRGKALLSDDDVSIYKPNLKKIDLSVNKSSGSNEPKKFKMSKKVRKINQLRKIKSRIIIRQK